MAKGYWIAHIEVTDLESFKEYISVSTKAVTDYGGRFLVRGGQAENPEGALRPRHVRRVAPAKTTLRRSRR